MYQPNAIITKNVKSNPHNDGSRRKKTFDQIRSGMTVGKFIHKGGKVTDLNFMVIKGYVSVKSKSRSKQTRH